MSLLSPGAEDEPERFDGLSLLYWYAEPFSSQGIALVCNWAKYMKDNLKAVGIFSFFSWTARVYNLDFCVSSNTCFVSKVYYFPIDKNR